STQLHGVRSDIVLPDNYHYIATGERDMDYPMEWTEIAPMQFGQQIVDLSALETIRQRSEERVKASPQFSKVLEYALRIKSIQDETRVPLHLDEYRALDLAREEESTAFKKAFGRIDRLSLQNLAV